MKDNNKALEFCPRELKDYKEPVIEDIEFDIEELEWKSKLDACVVFNKEKIDEFRDDVLLQEALNDLYDKEFLEVYEKLNSITVASMKDLFEKRNLGSKDTADTYIAMTKVNQDTALSTATNKLFSETQADRLKKILEANNICKDGSIKDMEFKRKEYEGSEQLLSILLQQEYYKMLILKEQLRDVLFNNSELFRKAKLARAYADYKLAMYEGSETGIQTMIDAKEAEAETKIQAVAVQKAQTLLLLRQYDGFAIDAKTKMLGVIYNAWSKAYATGLEAVPSAINDDFMTSLTYNISSIASGFDGGAFTVPLREISKSPSGDKVNIKVAWDSGVQVGTAFLRVSTSWSQNFNTDVTVPLAGTHTVSVEKPSKSIEGRLTIRIDVKYEDDPSALLDGAKDDDCCRLTCGVPYYKSSTIVLHHGIKNGTTDEASGVDLDPDWDKDLPTFNADDDEATCTGKGYFWCSISQACLYKPADGSGGGC